MNTGHAEITCDLEMTGVLLHHAEARMRQIDREGHLVPCLCLEVETESITRGRVVVEQPFPAKSIEQCEAAARRLKRGMRVTFTAPTVGIVLLARNVSHVHVHAEQEAA